MEQECLWDRTRQEKCYQMLQMSDTASRAYCRYKYRKCLRRSLIDTLLLGSADVSIVFVVSIIFEDFRRWTAIGIGSVCLIWIIFRYCRNVRENRRIRNAVNSGKFCEYCILCADYHMILPFLCSDGHIEHWRMEFDDDARVKDGCRAVVVYVPSVHRWYTEDEKTMKRVFETNE